MSNTVEVVFQTLRSDLVALRRATKILGEKLPEEDAKITQEDYSADEAVKKAIIYGGHFAQHIKEASDKSKDGMKPTSVSMQIGGAVVTWDLGQ